MTASALTQIEQFPFKALFTEEFIGLLKDTLTCLESVSPQLGSHFEILDHQHREALHGSDTHQAEALSQLLESVSDQQAQVLVLRGKLHALLFGLSLENRRERGDGWTTFIDLEIEPGNLFQALQIVSSPMNIQPEDEQTESPIMVYSDIKLF